MSVRLYPEQGLKPLDHWDNIKHDTFILMNPDSVAAQRTGYFMSMVNHKQLSQRESVTKKASQVLVKTGFPLKSESDVVDKRFDLQPHREHPVSIYSHQAKRAVANKIKNLHGAASTSGMQEMNTMLLTQLSMDQQEQPSSHLQKTLLHPKTVIAKAVTVPDAGSQCRNPGGHEDHLGDNLQIPKMESNGQHTNSHLQSPVYRGQVVSPTKKDQKGSLNQERMFANRTCSTKMVECSPNEGN